MTNLVIVESAAKAKTITKYLNSIPEFKDRGKFVVIASLGHVNDLPLKTMGVNLETWEAEYVPSLSKKAVIAKLKSAVKDATMVYLASDEDTEGEAIAYQLMNILRLKKATTHRITFHEITKNALKHAILHPRDVDMNRVAAQESRRILDRVVGYELSPLLWRRFATSKLSAGRVQSCALKMIVDRAQEIREHTPAPFWTVDGLFREVGRQGVLLKTKADEKWDEEIRVKNWMKKLAKQQGTGGGAPWVAIFKESSRKKNPPPPFTTSTLQQETYSRLGVPAKRTMQLAQGLYEAGLITYMRTDSVAIAEEAQQAILSYVETSFGADMVQPRVYKTKTKNAQEAHECVRVTDPYVKSAGVSGGEEMSPSHLRLYELIWKRTVATQMAPAIYGDVTYTVTSASCPQVEFRGKSSFLIEEGYLKVYGYEKEESGEGEVGDGDAGGDTKTWKRLLKAGQCIVEPLSWKAQGDVTKPPSMFNEPTLVKALEKESIGRPSTYATIIDKLFEKGYVMKGMNPSTVIPITSFELKLPSLEVQNIEDVVTLGGKDTDRMIPSSLGERVIEYLEPIVPFILDAKFTGSLEEELDTIMAGHTSKQKVLGKFYKKFHPEVEKALVEQKRNKADPKDKAAKPEGPLGPKNILKDFPKVGIQLVQTKYGPALFETSSSKFASITPYLQWKKIAIEELRDKDVTGIMRLPIAVCGSDTKVVAIGKYGLYIKDEKTKENIRLPKEQWEDAFEGKLKFSEIDNLKPVMKKK